MRNYQVYYDIESYVRKEVCNKFQEQGYIEAFDFFCIIIWKANRAKSKIAIRLFEKYNDLDKICKEITQKVFETSPHREKLRVLIKEYKFLLPTSSAILSILYPDDFSVYDYRVCETLKEYSNLGNLTNFDNIWEGYGKYLQAVKEYNPNKINYIDADQNLWGKSFYQQLNEDIKTVFARPVK